jgi:hydroxymethylbilane synthase
MAITKLRLGTRGSAMALIQTQLVGDALMQAHPGLEVELVTIKTEGDRNMTPIPLDTVGKAWFTAEIDRALTNGDIDLAVHSLKDLPLALDDNLHMVCVMPRSDPRDALLSNGQTLAQLPAGSVIGTDSTRRRALILHLRPDLRVTSLRGNVQTRLRKLNEGQYDGIVLAAAGLDRLDQSNLISEHFDADTFIPAIGQGALAVEVRRDRRNLIELLERIEDSDTVTAVTAEREFSARIGGGCKLPVGCYARIESDHITLHGMIGELDGSQVLFESISGATVNSVQLAHQLGDAILAKCNFQYKPVGDHGRQ